VVTAAVAPPCCASRVSRRTGVSEALHGEPLALLERREQGGSWLRVRGVDGYHAWTHPGYLRWRRTSEWAGEDWSSRGHRTLARRRAQV